MAIDVDAIRTRVRALGYELDTDPQQLQFMNMAQADVLGDHRWRFMMTSATVAAVAGTSVYTLPVSPVLQHVESIRFALPAAQVNPYPELQWRDAENFLATQALGDWAWLGVPDSPVFWNADVTPGSFSVFPTPRLAGTFTVRYFAVATQLTAGTDVPVIPEPYRDILTLGTAALCAARERDWASRDRWEAQKDVRVKAMKAQYGMRQRQTSRRVVSSQGY